MDPLQVPGGAESWWDRYGAIGAVAFLALATLFTWLRQLFSERKEDRERDKRFQDELDKRVSVLNEKLVEVVTESTAQTMRLLAEQNERHEVRYQALLERTMGDNRQHADALRTLTQSTVDVVNALVKKPRS